MVVNKQRKRKEDGEIKDLKKKVGIIIISKNILYAMLSRGGSSQYKCKKKKGRRAASLSFSLFFCWEENEESILMMSTY